MFEIVDVQSVVPGNSTDFAICKLALKSKPTVVDCDLLIAGGGMGGIAAALVAAKAGLKTCVTEETDWIGGQMTAQGVSALDENYLVETCGAARSYQELRTEIRQHYRRLPGASPAAVQNERLNPGNCWVSWLSFEPAVALGLLEQKVSALKKRKRLRIFHRTKVLQAKVSRGRVSSVTAVNMSTGKFIEFRPRFVIDATELGDLLPLCGIPYSSGAEPLSETGEPHAPAIGNPENVQDFTYPFVVEFRPGENHVIAKPADYEEFVAAGEFSFLGYKMFENAKTINDAGQPVEFLPFWEYRRLIAQHNFPNSTFKFDVSMINWESNDLRGENLIDAPAQMVARRLQRGKNISLGFLYWMQTQVPRDDGKGVGYPELFLRTDVLGTFDGLSKYPYIRESRRIKACRTIVEQDIAVAFNPERSRARLFPDTVGIGLYPIDIHGHQDVPGAGQASRPFQIPLGALVQTTVRNLVPACKNIGTTHVTNGAYRLHPVEWAIGEAAGRLASLCVRAKTTPEKVLNNRLKLRILQKELVLNGSPLFWFDDVPTDHPSFAAIQFVTAAGFLSYSEADLHFRPDDLVNKDEAGLTIALAAKVEKDNPLVPSGSEPLTVEDLRKVIASKSWKLVTANRPLISLPENQTLTRAQFAEWLFSAKNLEYLG